MSVPHTLDGGSLPRREPQATPPRRGRPLFWSIIVPGALTALAFKYLVPTRMAGKAGDATAAAARFASENPLIVILGIFIATSAAIHYWREWLLGTEDARPATWTRGRFGGVLTVTIVSALFLRTFVAEVYRVTSASMLPGLSVGDRLLVSKSAYGVKIPGVARRVGETLPKRGEVIVFMGDDPHGQGKTALVKRVMGLPGDTVVFSGGQALINGWQVPSCDAGPYVSFARGLTVRGRLVVEYLDNTAYLTVRNIGEKGTFQYIVQKGEVFVVGDDRGMSSDSRVWNDGRGAGVPAASITGRVTRVVVGGRPDGGLDFSRIFGRLGLELRQPGVDLKKTQEWIAGCLKESPSSVPPEKPRYTL
jgi:signal peptidase I